jgi:hypothetical protein
MPDEIVFLVVGKWEEIARSDPDDRASMSSFSTARSPTSR